VGSRRLVRCLQSPHVDGSLETDTERFFAVGERGKCLPGIAPRWRLPNAAVNATALSIPLSPKQLHTEDPGVRFEWDILTLLAPSPGSQ
jgi:hypothetical protein